MGQATEVVVFNFCEFSIASGGWVVSRHKAPRDLVDRIGGRVLEGTGQAVLREELNGDGMYRRLATGWGELDGN